MAEENSFQHVLLGNHGAPPSTMMTASLLPATTISISLCSSCSAVGLADKLAVNPADLDSGNRTRKGNIGNFEGRRRADHGEYAGIIVLVGRNDRSHDLGIIEEIFREKRADRPVDKTAGECFVVRRTAFPFEKTTRNFSAGIGLFLVVDGERERNPGPPLPFLWQQPSPGPWCRRRAQLLRRLPVWRSCRFRWSQSCR